MRHLLPVLFFSTGCLSISAQTAGQMYSENCAQCHGRNLEGGNAQSMVDGTWQFGDSRGHIFRNIKYGIPSLGMPSYETTLNDRQIKALVNYLLEKQHAANLPKPPLPEKLETLDYKIDVSVWTENLSIPWALTFASPKRAFITERPGTLRMVEDGKLHPQPIRNTPKVLSEGQGGLLDVAVDPNYAENGWVYLSYSHALDAGKKQPEAMTRIVRGKIRDHTWVDQQVLFEAPPHTYRTKKVHYGSRIVFDHDGFLYFSIGERGEQDDAQDLSRPNGKIHRIHSDGRIPQDNPFVNMPGAMPSIYSFGHRNPQGLSIHPQSGRIWSAEHGPMGGDELNLISAGLNYGWPVITYGRNYNGTVITDLERKAGMEQPAFYWKPSTAVCGIEFYQSRLFPKWENRLLVASLKYQDVRLLNIENDRVMHEEIILKNAGRVRDVAIGPDGDIYVVLNGPDTIIRLTPEVHPPDRSAYSESSAASSFRNFIETELMQ